MAFARERAVRSVASSPVVLETDELPIRHLRVKLLAFDLALAIRIALGLRVEGIDLPHSAAEPDRDYVLGFAANGRR